MLTIKNEENLFIQGDVRDKFKQSALSRLESLRKGCNDCCRSSFDDLMISSFVLTNWDQNKFDGESYYNLNTPNGIFRIYSQNNNIKNVST